MCAGQGRAGGSPSTPSPWELSIPMTISTATKLVSLRPVLLQRTCAPHPPESISGSLGLWRDASHHSSLLSLTCRGDTKNSLQDSPDPATRTLSGGAADGPEGRLTINFLHVEERGLPRWLSGKDATCQCRRRGFHP